MKMKKSIILWLIVGCSFMFAEENTTQTRVYRPVECGTGAIIRSMQAKEQKIIDDFKAHAKETPLMDNGLWHHIGHKDSPFEVLDEAIKGYPSWKKEDVALINGWDITHILFRHKEDLLIAVYQNENVRIYDAFFYKNKEHPEMIGLWGSSKLLFTQNVPSSVMLSKTDRKLIYFLELKDDYTFNNYGKSSESYSGKYYFTKEGKIGFMNVHDPLNKNAKMYHRSLEFKYQKDKNGFMLKY